MSDIRIRCPCCDSIIEMEYEVNIIKQDVTKVLDKTKVSSSSPKKPKCRTNMMKCPGGGGI